VSLLVLGKEQSGKQLRHMVYQILMSVKEHVRVPRMRTKVILISHRKERGSRQIAACVVDSLGAIASREESPCGKQMAALCLRERDGSTVIS